VPDAFIPRGLNASIPFPVVGDVIYHSEHYFWDVRLQSWRQIKDGALDVGSVDAFTEMLTYEWVKSPHDEGDGEYVRVLRSPPFDAVAFREAAEEANPGVVYHEIMQVTPSIHPSIRGLPDNTATIFERHARQGGLRLKSTNVRDARKEVLESRIGVAALQRSLDEEPRKTLGDMMDREYGRPVQTVVKAEVGTVLHVNASPNDLKLMKQVVMAAMRREMKVVEDTTDAQFEGSSNA
jgi:hypothetical protein